MSLGLLLPATLTAQDKASGSDTVASQNGDIKIYPVNHATLALVWQGKALYIDPVGGAQAFKGLPTSRRNFPPAGQDLLGENWLKGWMCKSGHSLLDR